MPEKTESAFESLLQARNAGIMRVPGSLHRQGECYTTMLQMALIMAIDAHSCHGRVREQLRREEERSRAWLFAVELYLMG